MKLTAKVIALGQLLDSLLTAALAIALQSDCRAALDEEEIVARFPLANYILALCESPGLEHIGDFSALLRLKGRQNRDFGQERLVQLTFARSVLGASVHRSVRPKCAYVKENSSERDSIKSPEHAGRGRKNGCSSRGTGDSQPHRKAIREALTCASAPVHRTSCLPGRRPPSCRTTGDRPFPRQ